jgi:hypothetical protein
MALGGANHTLQHSLTDPHIYSGISVTHSPTRILHQAQLSPIARQSVTCPVACPARGNVEPLVEGTIAPP